MDQGQRLKVQIPPLMQLRLWATSLMGSGSQPGGRKGEGWIQHLSLLSASLGLLSSPLVLAAVAGWPLPASAPPDCLCLGPAVPPPPLPHCAIRQGQGHFLSCSLVHRHCLQHRWPSQPPLPTLPPATASCLMLLKRRLPTAPRGSREWISSTGELPPAGPGGQSCASHYACCLPAAQVHGASTPKSCQGWPPTGDPG
ncbi:Hypothetical predicted protein [Marmota monax]|uniref:Uncharacterized protein n=1 Tax=Marmota monax TaxID=9995 RepID=A0A5E4BZP0_MARMO|nr:hypothetical protein GHT09_015739 [Marmota monax]VTJ74441.1 Hypothetical predicted protein [Marmota monax]